MTDATAPGGGALPEAGASQHSAASNRRRTAGDSPRRCGGLSPGRVVPGKGGDSPWGRWSLGKVMNG